MTPPPSSPEPERLLDGVPERRRPSVRPMAVGLSISAVLHVLALMLYPVLAPRPGELRGPSLSDAGGPELVGIEALRLLELPEEAEPEEPEEPEPEEPEEPAPPVEAPPRAAPVPAAEPGDGEETVPTDEELLTAAERLRPRVHDLRLWALPEDLTELTDEERMKLRLALDLAAVADSMAAAAEAARRATDWTFTDSDGKRWGVSPGRIHLGDITLPMPFNFAAPYDPSSDNAWQWEELEQGAAAAAARESAKERGRAIRERVDRERARLRGGPVRPDTSGVGG